MRKMLLLASFLFVLAGCGQKTQPTTEKPVEVKKEIPGKKDETNDLDSVINGKLSYPSDFIPKMKICAISLTNKKQTCVDNNNDSFSLKLKADSYFIYASVSDLQKAYYTKCDDDFNESKCNSIDWHKGDFVCFKDKNCKEAFTPLVINLKSKEIKELKTITQGWYLPCDNECKSDPNFWNNYLN